MRARLLAVAGLALAACAPAPSGSSSDANRVRAGMSVREVVDVLGPAGVWDVARDGTIRCSAHIYGEMTDPRWVHVLYADNAVTRATDGHASPCGR
ncbi:hypothetical protein [Roseobacter sp. HKCCA0434]|uniref:hypothetical protein n=1 Tax=Roseobacter sp. HKCCA0434 TaxID=3079297 RepID=UPI002905B18B|nr:hypothetical protein [Roseobacter sp. HKCCA0434]